MYFSPKHLEINVSNQPKYKNSLNKVKLLKKNKFKYFCKVKLTKNEQKIQLNVFF